MKLAMIGGGGVRTAFFAESLARHAKRLGIDELSIMDNNEEKLEIYGVLAQKIAIKGNGIKNVSLTTDFTKAVKNADYVITTLRVGNDEGRIKDERIALSHGVIGQETTGPGGFSFALRTIPVMLEYCKIINEISNNAIVFNFTNPSGLVTQAMHSHGYHNVVGICDGPTHMKSEIANSLDISVDDLFTRIYGLNHLSWTDSVKVKDMEILPRLLKSDHFLDSMHEFAHFDKSLIRMLGCLPNSYLYYYYYKEKALKNILSSPKTRGETIKEINDKMNKLFTEINVSQNPDKAMQAYYQFFEDREKSYMSIELGHPMETGKKVDLREEIGLGGLDLSGDRGEVLEGYSGVAFNYIEAVKNNSNIDLPISVPNNGAIRCLMPEDVTEISCIINKSGAHPVRIDNIPERNTLLIQQVKRFERLTVQAIDEKSKELAIDALMGHPLVGSYSLAKDLVDDYIEVFKDYLGEWK